MNNQIVKKKTKTKRHYKCNIPIDCNGNQIVSSKANPTIRSAIPSNSAPNPTPSSGSGTTQAGGKWSNYGVDASLFIGGSGFIHRRNGRTICNGRTGGFSPNPIRHWRKQLFPRQGGCTGKNSLANMQDTPGSTIVLTENRGKNFSGNYTDIYVNLALSMAELCNNKNSICLIENQKKQSRSIPVYSKDYHSSTSTYLQSRGQLYRQQSAINFKKLKTFPCQSAHKPTHTDYIGLYTSDASNCYFTDGSCAVGLAYNPVNAVFGTNTAVAGSLYAQNRTRTTLTENQYNIINRWGLDSVSVTKIYPVVRTIAPGYRKLNGGTGIHVTCCPAFVPPPPWLGNGFFIFTIPDELWTRITTFMGSDISSVPVISNIGPSLPITIVPDLDQNGNLNGRTRVTVEYHYQVGNPATCGFTMGPLLDALYADPSFNDLIYYDVNIVQWGAIPFSSYSSGPFNDTHLFRSFPTFLPDLHVIPRIAWSGKNQAVTLTHDQYPIKQWNTYPQIDTPLILTTSSLNCAFAGCNTLTTADFGNINNWDISQMTSQLALLGTFQGCTNFNCNLGKWDTQNIETLISTFRYCSNFEGNGLENWQTGKVTDMTFLFSQCFSLKAKIGNWDVGKCSYFNQCFQNCINFTGDLITNWQPAAVLSIQYMFAECINFNPTGDLGYWDVSQCLNFDSVFEGCIKFQGTGLSRWRTDKMKTAQRIFYNDISFNQDLSGWNITKLINIIGGPSGSTGPQYGPMVDAFYGCKSMSVKNMTSTLVGWGRQILDPSAYNISLGMYGTTYYVDKYGVFDLSNVYGWNYNSLGYPYYSPEGYLPPVETHVVPTYLTGLTNWRYAYYKSRGWPANTIGADPSNIPIPPAYPTISGDYIVPQSDFSGWVADAKLVTNMSYMFADCSGFEGLGLTVWNPLSLTNANGMFQNCKVLNKNFGGWNVANLKTAASMYQDCSALTGLGMPSWNTSNVTDMSGMFQNCSSLISIDTSTSSYWNVSKCLNFAGMFQNCPKYIGYGLPSWNTSSANNFTTMFKDDPSFNTDVSKWNTIKVYTMKSMFENCSTFNQDLSGWSIRSLINADRMLNNTATSIQNYTNLLYKWGTSPAIQQNVPLGANNCYYYHDAVAPRLFLVSAAHWIIDDLGPSPPFVPGVASMTNWSGMFIGSVGQVANLAGFPFPAPIPGLAIVSGSEFSHWDPSMVTNTTQMFQNCATFKGGGLDAWIASKSTSNIQYFTKMFQGCADFSQNFGSWIVTSGISMDSMFSGCLHWLGTGVSKWHPSSAKTMSNMFNGCTIFNQDLSGWSTDISLVTTTNSMFQNCGSFTGNSTINTNNTSLKLWNTSSVTDMSGMFQNATVFNQDLSWNTSSVTTTTRMFQNAAAFNGNIMNWNTINDVSMNSMFQGATAFTQDLSGWNTSNVTTMNSMFKGVSSFNKNIGKWDTSNVTDMSGMFQTAAAFNQDISGWKISSLQNAANMLSGSGMSTKNYTLLLKNWGQAIKSPRTDVSFGAVDIKYYQWAQTGRKFLTDSPYNWTISDSGLDSTQIGFPPSIAVLTDWSSMFFGGVGSTTDPSYVDVSGYLVTAVSDYSDWISTSVTNFQSMFSVCSNFVGIGCPQWKTTSAVNMSLMFNGCTNFNQDLSGWNTSNVTNMSGMFGSCSLFNKDLSWNTSNVTNMNNMFKSATSFNGNINNWNTSKVTDMGSMFQNDINFNKNISKWITSKVTTMSSMFNGCTAFNQDLSGWDISGLTDATNMLNGCGMSTTNYTKLLIGWAAQPSIRPNVVFGAQGLMFLQAAAAAHQSLTSAPNNWIITDAGQAPSPAPPSIAALTDWSYMFYDGVGSTVNTSFFDVSGYVLTTTTDFTLWDPSMVTNLTSMFQRTPTWQGIGLPVWNMSSATNMTSMFQDCSAFNQDLSGWNIHNVTSLKNMFSGCTTFDANLSGWDISNVTDASGMLDNCGMSSQNYSLILYYWALQAPHIRPNVKLGALGLTYFPWAASARNVLTSAPYNWIITDGGVNLIQIGYPPSINDLINWSNMFNGGIGNSV